MRWSSGLRSGRGSLLEAQRKLVDTAHRAGMAEIATSVLHNVGNALNSVNVSATLIFEALHRSSSDKLLRVAELLPGKQRPAGGFMSSDRGRIIPAYLRSGTPSRPNATACSPSLQFQQRPRHP